MKRILAPILLALTFSVVFSSHSFADENVTNPYQPGEGVLVILSLGVLYVQDHYIILEKFAPQDRFKLLKQPNFSIIIVISIARR